MFKCDYSHRQGRMCNVYVMRASTASIGFRRKRKYCQKDFLSFSFSSRALHTLVDYYLWVRMRCPNRTDIKYDKYSPTTTL